MDAPPATDHRTCRNCGQVLSGRFCAACGQEDRPLQPSLRELLADAWAAATNLEGNAYQSVARLIRSPGFLTREYFEGRRARWVSPVRLYLIISVVYFGLTSLTAWGAMDIDVSISGDSDVDLRSELEERGFASESDLVEAAQQAVATWLPRAMFLLVPIFASLVAIARRGAGRTYPEHLTFSLHVHAATFCAFALSALLSGLVGGEVFDSIVGVISFVYAAAYLVLALRTAYGGSLRRGFVQGLVIGATYSILAIAVTIAILVPVVLR